MHLLLLLVFVALPLAKLVLTVAWPGLLKRLEGRRTEAHLVSQFGAIQRDTRVSQVGQKLLAGSTLAARFGVLPGPIKNAVALPNGRILLWEGLIEMAGDDTDMLAGVLAHELGHLKHEHFLNRVQWAAMASFILGYLGGGWARRFIQNLAATAISRGFSRRQELEADDTAVHLMRRAGYDPAGLARLLDQLDDGSAPGSLMGTHPDPAARASRIRKKLGLSPKPRAAKKAAPAPPSNVLPFPGRK